MFLTTVFLSGQQKTVADLVGVKERAPYFSQRVSTVLTKGLLVAFLRHHCLIVWLTDPLNVPTHFLEVKTFSKRSKIFCENKVL